MWVTADATAKGTNLLKAVIKATRLTIVHCVIQYLGEACLQSTEHLWVNKYGAEKWSDKRWACIVFRCY